VSQSMNVGTLPFQSGENEWVELHLGVVNETADELSIIEVVSGCSCASAYFPGSSDLVPKQRQNLAVRLWAVPRVQSMFRWC